MLKQHRFKVLVAMLVLAALLVAFDVNSDYTIAGKLGIGTESPAYDVDLIRNQNGNTRLRIQNESSGNQAWTDFYVTTGAGQGFAVQKFGSNFNAFTGADGQSLAGWSRFRSDSQVKGLLFVTGGAGNPLAFGTSDGEDMRIDGVGRVGIGTKAPSARLDVKGSSSDTYLLRLSDSTGTQVLSVDPQGNMSSKGLLTAQGGADVAERIDATEALEAGDVVEIDPDNPGKFRKARVAMSQRVAGVISTAPGITLANGAEGARDKRPLLALAGRVPVKATAKFGSIEVGDLLVSSAIPGYAMKCAGASQCIGAIVGKALEPLEQGTGTIEIQVTLR